jgi:Ser/Thr protein kinase RdoA (MazF antagonist)
VISQPTDTRLVEQLAKEYGIAVGGWRQLTSGWTTNLYVDPGFVVRLHPTDTNPARLGAMQAARRAVREAGIPAVPPLSTPDGRSFVTLPDGRLAEVERFVEWDGRMNTAARLETGFGLLARTHDALRTAALPAAAQIAPRANHIAAAEEAAATHRGADRIRSWGDPVLSAFADAVTAHIDAVAAAEDPNLPAQVVHGDFWDDNVLFRGADPVAVLDFDFMAERPRIDDLALTAYFYLLEPTVSVDAASRRQLCRFVDAYDAAAAIPLSATERAALPLAIARQPAWSVGRWVVKLPEPAAIDHATSIIAELPVAQAILADLPAWQAALFD